MNRGSRLTLALILAVVLAGCSGGSNSATGSLNANGAMVPVTLSMEDSIPAGISVVSFEVNVTSAMLTPGNVPLLVKNADIELTHLQSEPALIGSRNVPAGDYTGLAVTFDSTAQIALVNNSGSAINLAGGTSCPSGSTAVCTGTINVNPAAITAPITVNLAANAPLGFIVHFDLNKSIVSGGTTLSVSPAVDIRKIVPQAGVVHEEHLVGTITGVSAPNFTLQPGLGGPGAGPAPVTITTDSNTKFVFVDDPDDRPRLVCAVNGFSCLQAGQTVRVTLEVQAGGTLLAKRVALFDPDDRDSGLHGIIVSLSCPSPATNCFQMVLRGGEFRSTSNAGLGARVIVNVAAGAAYKIDLDGLTLPGGLTFASFSDLAVGQEVQIQLAATPQATGGVISVTTSRIRLVESVVTGTLKANPSGTPPQFTLSGSSLPPIFGGVDLNVKTTADTRFCTNNPGVVSCTTGVSGLAAGDTVSAGGLLFGNTSPPTMVAEGVLKRQ